MNWSGALQKTGTLSRLEKDGKDVRAVTVYTHMFVLRGRDGRADDREDLHYTAEGATPKEAMQAAHAVYEKAIECQHALVRKSPTVLECRWCGVQKRTTMTHTSSANKAATKKPERLLFGIFRLG